MLQALSSVRQKVSGANRASSRINSGACVEGSKLTFAEIKQAAKPTAK